MFSSVLAKAEVIFTPTTHDIARAMAAFDDESAGYALSHHRSIAQAQIKCLAMGYAAARGGRALPETEEQQPLDPLEIYRRRTRQMMGSDSIYGGIALGDPTNEPRKPLVAIRRFVQRGDLWALLLLGPVRTGKTFACVAGAAELPGPRKFVRAYEVYQALESKNYAEQEAYKKIQTLVLDELGVEPVTGYKSEDFRSWFQDLISYRHEKKKYTLMTSNLEIDAFKKQYGERIYRRIEEAGAVVAS